LTGIATSDVNEKIGPGCSTRAEEPRHRVDDQTNLEENPNDRDWKELAEKSRDDDRGHFEAGNGARHGVSHAIS
jgi:hypothetical protein